MLDSQLMSLVGLFLTGIVNQFYPNLGPFEVIQEAQPTQQGTPTVPTITFIKAPGDTPRGWPIKTRNIVNGKTIETMTQLYETSIQISCLKWQNPETPNSQVVTASDLLNTIQMAVMYRPGGLTSFNSLNVLRVIEVSNEPFENDDHRFEFHPTFTLVFTHSREISLEIESIKSAEAFIYRV